MNSTKASAKDFFLNLGAIVALYTVVVSLLNLLFTVINRVYPQTTVDYFYGSASQTISWPVAILIIFFPIFILLMWLLEKGFVTEPEKRNVTVRRWLSFITLFLAGIAMAVDLVTVIYKFLDGQDLTTAFLLKIVAVLLVSAGVFIYYITDIRQKLTPSLRKIWLGISTVIILGSIVWGFSVLGSPATQRLYKYDDAKVVDLQNISSAVQNYYSVKGVLPKNFEELAILNYGVNKTDSQTQKSYEYKKTSNTTYEVCAEFNKASGGVTDPNYTRPVGDTSWTHPAGRYCFPQAINTSQYPGVKPVF